MPNTSLNFEMSFSDNLAKSKTGEFYTVSGKAALLPDLFSLAFLFLFISDTADGKVALFPGLFFFVISFLFRNFDDLRLHSLFSLSIRC